CFSSTTTLMPARASRKPSIIPAGPPPTMQHRVVSACAIQSDPNHALRGIYPDHAQPSCICYGRRAVRRRRRAIFAAVIRAPRCCRLLNSNECCVVRSTMGYLTAGALVACLLATGSVAETAVAQPGSGELKISWEVRNRFRLFREEKDFLLHAEAL